MQPESSRSQTCSTLSLPPWPLAHLEMLDEGHVHILLRQHSRLPLLLLRLLLLLLLLLPPLLSALPALGV